MAKKIKPVNRGRGAARGPRTSGKRPPVGGVVDPRGSTPSGAPSGGATNHAGNVAFNFERRWTQIRDQVIPVRFQGAPTGLSTELNVLDAFMNHPEQRVRALLWDLETAREMQRIEATAFGANECLGLELQIRLLRLEEGLESAKVALATFYTLAERIEPDPAKVKASAENLRKLKEPLKLNAELERIGQEHGPQFLRAVLKELGWSGIGAVWVAGAEVQADRLVDGARKAVVAGKGLVGDLLAGAGELIGQLGEEIRGDGQGRK